MAFSMNNMSSGLGGNAKVLEGDSVPEIPEAQTAILGFKTLHGDKKARVAPAWPQDALPPSYASLLSLASANGLYAAAGPQNLVIGKTDDARSRIYDSQAKADVRDCEPIHTIPHSRLAHVAFAADESCLVVAEETATELLAYSTSDLQSKRSNVALKLSTNAPVRAVIPNPDPAQAQYFAILNANGQLLLADLAQGQLVSGANGPVLSENVSCIAWSTKGKQLMAGRADCTAVQLKPDGSVVATVPKPSGVPENCHLAHISWIETDVFLFIYTPSHIDDVGSMVNEYYIVKTNKGRSEFTFHKFALEPVFPVVDRTPAHFHVSRLRNYAPNLDELLILASTVAPEIKMITKGNQPLSAEISDPGVYSLTVPEDDGRSAATPMGQDGSSDTTAIGMAIDLSDKDPIVSPVPSDPEIQDSKVPLPELFALNNEGLVSIWAVIYDDGVKAEKPYPAFAEIAKITSSAGNTQGESMEPTSTSAPVEASKKMNGFASAAASPFAASNENVSMNKPQSSAFAAGSGFGQPSAIGGGSRPSWASTGFVSNTSQSAANTSAQPTFGSTATMGSVVKPAFGQTGFGSPAQPTPTAPAFGQPSKPAFGQTGFGASPSQSSPFAAASKGPSTSSPFANAGASSSSGFGSFASQGGGFAAINKDNKTGASGGFGSGSGFGEASKSSPFASAASKPSPFSQASGSSAFGKPATSPFGNAASTSSLFAQASQSSFKVESTFQKDETSKDDDKDESGAGFGFGSFGGMLGANQKKAPEAVQSPSKEEDMDDDDEDESSGTEVEAVEKPQKTPPATLTQPKQSTTPHVSSLFGQSTTPQTLPPHSKQDLSTGWGFSNVPSTTPKDTPAPAKFSLTTNTTEKTAPSIFDSKALSTKSKNESQESETTKPFSYKASDQLSDSDRVRSLSDDDEEDIDESQALEAPLPPDPFSKPGYQAGDTSMSSLNSKASTVPEDAPLPPTWKPANKTASESLKTQPSDIPSSILSSDFDEGSGEDVTGDVSPVEERESEQGTKDDHVVTSPESSFGRTSDHSPVTSPTGGVFTKVNKVEQPKPKPPLFGEVQQPIFPPPQPKQQESPRSPSPMRKPPRQSMLSKSPERSFSAPAHPRSLIAQRKADFAQSSLGQQAQAANEQEIARDLARREAERVAREKAEAAETAPLIDDDDEILQKELAKPTQPSENLDPFITIHPGKATSDLSPSKDGGRLDIPSQIEKLYQDINGMIVTLGINAKSLSSYLLYQTSQEQNESWPSVLTSETPLDALNDEYFLSDIETLHLGTQMLESTIESSLSLDDITAKLESTQTLLTRDITDLRGRIIALRKSTSSRLHPNDSTHAPLSAEQTSIQQDLRKSSANIFTSLSRVEEDLVVLRAKIADLAPPSENDNEKGGLDSFAAMMMISKPKRPSVEAVMGTIGKLTSMAEKRSADVDVIEAQMRKLGLEKAAVAAAPTTPERRIVRRQPTTPGSAKSTDTVFHTPESGSRSTRSIRGTPGRGTQMVVSAEDRQSWTAKAKHKRDIAKVLRRVLREKNVVAGVGS